VYLTEGLDNHDPDVVNLSRFERDEIERLNYYERLARSGHLWAQGRDAVPLHIKRLMISFD
jgi:hypothetical protein